ncbi:MAG: hypothetical protein JW822_08505 [Spirochaetales bacterium]|nr:hypothetical protein [Spirochaetales bacterium]
MEDFAERTKLLSINASIESTRAGAVGKGFAVVAGEIRKLASQSTRSTTDIVTLISSQIINQENDVAVEEIAFSIKELSLQSAHLSKIA